METRSDIMTSIETAEHDIPPSADHAVGWKLCTHQLGYNHFDIYLTTRGEVFALANLNAKANAMAGASYNGPGGILTEIVADNLVKGAMASKISKMDLSQDDAPLHDRLHADDTSLMISASEIAQVFTGETAFGFGKRRAGIYFHESMKRSVPGGGSPDCLWIPHPNDRTEEMNATIHGWCEALGLPQEGFDAGTMPDAQFLEGPQKGETALSADKALTWMRDHVRGNFPPPAERKAAEATVTGENPLANRTLGLGAACMLFCWAGCLTYALVFATLYTGKQALDKAGVEGGMGRNKILLGMGLSVASVPLGFILGGVFAVIFG